MQGKEVNSEGEIMIDGTPTDIDLLGSAKP